MATITTIAAGDLISNSRTDINTNFSNLNADKFETSNIDTNTALTANSDTKVASQKATKAYVDSQSILTLSSEFTDGVTHSLTTTATQRVIIWATGQIEGTGGGDIILDYGGSDKYNIGITAATDAAPFCLVHTFTPGAATANITVETTAGSLLNVRITVLKFNI